MKVAVVGCGLMGAAAARHLAKAGHEVVLIGPDEPADKAQHRGVFASHYDEGRITRKNATDPYWVEASTAAIDRYGEIEAESGIRFFSDVGALMAGPADWVAQVNAAGGDVASQTLDHAELAQRFPYFAFPEGWQGAYEPTSAGYISPRRLVAAQARAAENHGARRVLLAATRVGGGTVTLADGATIHADQVLVATGGMTDHVLGRAPALQVYARTVALFEVTPQEVARLGRMPSVVYGPPDEPYLLPPILYPDGKTYLKLGTDPVDVPLGTPAEIGDWFRTGGAADVRDFQEARMRRLMPDLKYASVQMDACMTTWTGDGYPEIRRLSDGLSVCTGGNGAGAKCSDELGRRGAVLATHQGEL